MNLKLISIAIRWLARIPCGDVLIISDRTPFSKVDDPGDRGEVLTEFSFSAFPRAHRSSPLSFPLSFTLFLSFFLALSTSHHPLFPDIGPIVLVDRNFTVYIGICCWRYKSSLKEDDEAYSRVLLSFSFPSTRVPLRNCLFADESNRLSWKKYFQTIGKKRRNKKKRKTEINGREANKKTRLVIVAKIIRYVRILNQPRWHWSLIKRIRAICV